MRDGQRPPDPSASVAPHGAGSSPAPSIVVGTRDRGASVASTIQSIVESDLEDFEVVVVDQSRDHTTADALRPFRNDSRLQYHHSETQGLGASKNVGLRLASSPYVLYTDDDVVVPATWTRVMRDTLHQSPHVGILFSNVAATPFDADKGFVPAYAGSTNKIIRRPSLKWRSRGIGASMAVRAEAAATIGGFDAATGSGSRFRSGEEIDFAIRCLLAGWWVQDTVDVEVLHAGFRTWHEGRDLTRRDWFGIGAVYAKPLKAGRLSLIPSALVEVVGDGLLEPFGQLAKGRRPRGFRRLLYFGQGLVDGIRTPVDARTMRYLTETGESDPPLADAEAARRRPPGEIGPVG
jgi:GT2 family glycosyltransferase